MFIKRLYQLVRLIEGKPYDWQFKISESSRDKNCIGTRQDIIRKLIRDKLKIHSEILSQTISSTYKTQIRNSIAHSNYSFLGRNLHLNNFIKNDPACQIINVPFDEWIDIFHNTIIFHNEYVRLKNTIHRRYSEFARKENTAIEILVPNKKGELVPHLLEYRPKWDDWTSVTR
ncbi:MAG: hypothetical protein EOP48_05375 [Sphingobacteriales bacterium]|nr:MAG: hypothetical protein EOP48_05375 [Sphingobacteriales bacterium]